MQRRKNLTILVLALVLVFFGGQRAFAGEQDFKEAFDDIHLYDDTLIVVDTTAAPGESFWVTVNLTNKTIDVAGFSFTRMSIHAGNPCNGKKTPDRNTIGNISICITA